MSDNVKRLALSYAELAEAIGVTERHVQRMVQKGELKVARLGRRCLVPMAEVERLLEEAS